MNEKHEGFLSTKAVFVCYMGWVLGEEIAPKTMGERFYPLRLLLASSKYKLCGLYNSSMFAV